MYGFIVTHFIQKLVFTTALKKLDARIFQIQIKEIKMKFTVQKHSAENTKSQSLGPQLYLSANLDSAILWAAKKHNKHVVRQ